MIGKPAAKHTRQDSNLQPSVPKSNFSLDSLSADQAEITDSLSIPANAGPSHMITSESDICVGTHRLENLLCPATSASCAE
jgi:hypothetical protein